jgi:hypothetical protein
LSDLSDSVARLELRKLTTDAKERLSEFEPALIASVFVIASFPDINSKSTTPKA